MTKEQKRGYCNGYIRAYVANNSFKELDDQMETAIINSKDPDKFLRIWNVVKAELNS